MVLTANKLENFLREKGIYVAMITVVCGLIGIPLLFWFASVTVIGIGTLFILFFGSGLLGLIQWKYLKNYLDMAYNQFAMYAFIGFGMCLLNFILLLNHLFAVNTHSETYSISRQGYYNEIIIEGDQEYMALERNLNTYLGEHMNEASFLSNKVIINFETGLFGFDKIIDCKFE